jgi:hypothetical protein
MSKWIPRRAIDSHRNSVDVVMNMLGIDCSLFIPTLASSAIAEKLDIYELPEDKVFVEYTAKVFVEWNPNIHRLKKLGVFAEDSLPIIGKFGRKAAPVLGSNAGTNVEVDIIQGSWFRISLEYVPENVSEFTDFEVVNIIAPEVHDAMIWKEFLIAPMRIQN